MKPLLAIAVVAAVAALALAGHEHRLRELAVVDANIANNDADDLYKQLNQRDAEVAKKAKAATDAGAQATAAEQALASAATEKQQLKAKLAKAEDQLKKLAADIEKPSPPVVEAKPAKPRPYKNAALSDAILKARDEGKDVVIVFRQTYCPPCDEFEARCVRSHYIAQETGHDFEFVTIDVDKDPATAKLFEKLWTPRKTPFVFRYAPNQSNDEARIVKRFIPSTDPSLFLSELTN